jgi:hypothetical protein
MKNKKGTVKIIRFLRPTPGGKHGWYEAEITDENGSAVVEIRKPLLDI